MAKILTLVPIVTLSTGWLYLLHYFAPSIHTSADVKMELSFPSNLKELQTVALALQAYSVNHWWYVLLIFGSAYIYKQAFCVPGSLFLNMLAGALYGHIGGLFFACLFTATGATICYLLSRTYAKDLVFKYFPKRFESFEEKVNSNQDRLFYFMLFLRLVPVAPGWVINVISPLVGIPIVTFYITTFLGLGPYNFVGVSAGGMLSSLKSVNDVFTWKTFLNISIIALFALGPALILKPNLKKKKNDKSS